MKARTRDEGRALARYFKESGYDLIKVYDNVSREGYLGLAEEARRLDLPFADAASAVSHTGTDVCGVVTLDKSSVAV